MEASHVDFATSNEQAGFRLHRFEVYNWGTFHERVWRFAPTGENSLLTGDIGSGKSTLVDALTTLLVPPQRITFNKAAGADPRERSLRSYVLGFYKSERAETGLSARAVPLRDQNSYSVILGHFRNAGYGEDVTLAQVFWIKDTQGQPARLYLVAERALEIAEDFAGFGSDIAGLRKRLRKMAHVESWDTFPPYGAAFRRRFGIENEQAMELFNQTVSMKSVGNLTDFVRGHMLEPFPVEDRIEALTKHFDDLSHAHEAVLKAKAQIDALEPLIKDADDHAERIRRILAQRACRDALRSWFARLKLELLDQRLEGLERKLADLAHRLVELAERLKGERDERDELKRAIAENGGDRLERLKGEIERFREQKEARHEKAQKYRQFAQAVGLPEAGSASLFEANRRSLLAAREKVEGERIELQNAMTEAAVAFQTLKREHDELQVEVHSLRQRRSNVPARMLEIRGRICESLAVSEDELPFAGELIQVREEEREWEGAAERVLHGFGISLLVPDPQYARVAAWVDRTHLYGRLVYYRVRKQPAQSSFALHPRSLVRKLDIRPDCDMYDWLEVELVRRFDYACCDDMENFRREQSAITRAGQVKGRGERHEKDDRHRIDDRSRYVLGWSNEAKIAALEQQAAELARRMQKIADRISGIQGRQETLQERLDALTRLETFTRYRDLDWRPLASEIQRLEKEREELETASDVLRQLQGQLDELERLIAESEGERVKLAGEDAVAREEVESTTSQRLECQGVLEDTPVEITERIFPQLEALRGEAIGADAITLRSSAGHERRMREWLQARIDAEQKQIDRVRDRVIKAMEAYKLAWPLETRDVDVNIEAAAEYRAMLEQLRTDDLPRFERKFKELLNENTIREVAGFQAQLRHEQREIRERIERINRSLQGIDYNSGRYIALLAEPTQDAEVRDFQQELRACTEGALTGSEDAQYSEQKFLQVKRIIERFRGRQGTAEQDRRWRRKVTDVRNWFVFSASERWREDDGEHEHYSDSGGKSGGQKEKLAYTVLAASLAYQFGLEFEIGEKRSRSFRFVVIDEAFGRGSDESARYGLELFRRLNLQLLIVTPLQKIHVIEPFVSSVGFVHNADGRYSMLRSLTIEEYRAEKAARGLVATLP